MRLLRFLNETTGIFELDVEKECPTSWELRDSLQLYRGMKTSKSEGKETVRKDRRPLDSSIIFHNILDSAFYKVFGVKARSQTVFCTGDQWQAERYGELFQIFIPNKFTAIYSETFNDLYNFANVCRRLHLYDDNIMALTVLSGTGGRGWAEKKFNLTYNSSEKEVQQAVLAAFPNCAEWFVKKFYKKISTFEDLKKAANTHSEIMIDCAFYYFAHEGVY